ncbi:MAG: hypothetical protein R8P61_15255 [Bacteroidia bacterium]|nr:hypothetical protein [Bacteroidia bacterium]
MKALDKSITCQIKWLINGRALKKQEFVSTSYLNRGQERNLAHPDFHKFPIEIHLSRDLFLEIFAHAYDPFVAGEKEEDPYEWDQFEVFDRLRCLSYPDLEVLYQDHKDLLTLTVLELETDFSDLIAMERESESEISVYLHLWKHCIIEKEQVCIQGLALSAQALD